MMRCALVLGLVLAGCGGGPDLRPVVSPTWNGDEAGPKDSGGHAWYEVAFDDRAWKPIAPELYRVDTPVSWTATGPDEGKPDDRYVRIHFDWNGTDRVVFRFESDDGTRMYVNGKPWGSWGAGWRKAGCVNRCDGPTVLPIELPSTMLVRGDNVVAFDIWNAGGPWALHLEIPKEVQGTEHDPHPDEASAPAPPSVPHANPHAGIASSAAPIAAPPAAPVAPAALAARSGTCRFVEGAFTDDDTGSSLGAGALVELTIDAGRLVHVRYAANIVLPDGRPVQIKSEGDGPPGPLRDGEQVSASVSDETLQVTLRGDTVDVEDPHSTGTFHLTCQWH